MDIIGNNIRQIFERKGYQFFDSGKRYNLNLFGIRYPDGINEWSDFICLLYRDERLNWQLHQWAATTKSGIDGLRNPVNKSGTGLLVPWQYLGVYRLDLHKGRHMALCQRNGPVKVYRDNNRDLVIDSDPATIQEGDFGVNIHSPFSDSGHVDGRSVACQVVAKVEYWNQLYKIVDIARELYGNKFTYTLFEETDFAG